MTKTAFSLVAMTIALGACTSTGARDNLGGTRTVFHNPFATMERFEEEMQSGVYFPSSGRVAFDRDGNPVRLRREERRAMRDRTAAVRSTLILRKALEKDQRVPVRLDAPSRREDGGEAPAMEPSPAAPPLAVLVAAAAPAAEEPQ